MCIAARRSGPGLVLGLDLGGACRGVAYRVAAKKRAETIAYLRAREQATSVYRETHALGDVADASRSGASRALVYMIDRGHMQYAGRLDLATQLHLVRQGHGQSGPNRDYVLSTVQALEALGFYDRDLHLLAERLRGRRTRRARASEAAGRALARPRRSAARSPPRSRAAAAPRTPPGRAPAGSDRALPARSCRDSAGTCGAARTARN